MNKLGDWLAAIVPSLGPWGIFLVALADSALIPIPQGVDLLLITQILAAPSTAYLTAGLAVTGSLLGSFVLYSVARRAGEMMLRKRAPEASVDTIRRQIDRYGALALALPAMIPIPLPMKPFVIGAGAFQMKQECFLAVVAVSRFVRYFGEAFLALKYGEQTTEFLRDNITATLVVGGILILAFFLIHHYATHWLSEP